MILSTATGTGYWQHGIVLAIVNYAMFFSLPIAQGYKLYGRSNDVLRHIGDVQAIVETGSLPGIWYPGEHVLMAELSMLGIPIDLHPSLMGFLFTTVYILGIGTLIQTLSNRRASVAAGLAAATPLVLTSSQYGATPWMISFTLLPVFLTALERYRRTKTNNYLAIVVVVGLFVVYTHPMTTMFMTVMVGVTAGYSIFHNQFVDSDIRTLSPRLAVVFPVLLFAWISDFDQTRETAIQLFQSTQGSTQAAQTVQEATEVTFTPVDLLVKFLHLYGTVALYSTVALLIALLGFRLFLRLDVEYWLGFSTVQFGTGVAIAIVFFANDLIVSNTIRSARYAALIAVVAVGLMLYNRLLRRDLALSAVIAVIILTTAVIGANATYGPNDHLTHSEFDGTEFILEHKQDGPVYSAKTRHVFEEYVLGSGHLELWPPDMGSENTVPRELGYTEPETRAGETFGNSILVTKQYDIEQNTAAYYTEEQRELLFLYNRSHLNRLERDTTASKVYSNGGFVGWDVSTSG